MLEYIKNRQRLMEEKELYQVTAKETLKKLVDENLEAVKKQI